MLKKLRTVGNPDTRFQEDSLRLLRGLRFVNVLNQKLLTTTKNKKSDPINKVRLFDFEPETWKSIKSNHNLLKTIAKERIKEELALHKSREAAIQTGFAHAFWAIMDSNITTFIAALFLSILGTGPIKGFAYSLTIGVVSSVFTALFVSRLIFDFGTETLRQKKLRITWRTLA